MIDIDKLKALHEAATELPWTYDPEKSLFVQAIEGRADIVELDGWPLEYIAEERGNGHIIAFLRNAVPEIIAQSERLARYELALKYYADDQHYDSGDVPGHIYVLYDHGRYARQALNGDDGRQGLRDKINDQYANTLRYLDDGEPS